LPCLRTHEIIAAENAGIGSSNYFREILGTEFLTTIKISSQTAHAHRRGDTTKGIESWHAGV
jgi:hypothetical protein